MPTATVIDISRFLLSTVILRCGPPHFIVSGRGRQFVTDVVEELLRLCDCQFRHATSYHPQTNDLVERTNRTLTNMVSI